MIAASVIVPCFNQLDVTRHCFRALFRHTGPAFELIVIDNGSTDGTGAYLAGAQDTSRAPVTVISNGRNLGFPAAVNQGLRVARGHYLVLLNNDAVVTDGWLDQLIALAEMKTGSTTESTEDTEGDRGTEGTTNQSDPHPDPDLDLIPTPNPPRGTARQDRQSRIGLVGPMSNYASPPPLVQPVPYKRLEEMHGFATRWREEHRGQWFTVGKLTGFCLLMKRAVYETIGGLDERFGLGLYDDDDLAVRARRAGFGLAVAHDLFIHHFGSRTFAGAGIDAERLLQENGRKFAEKWGAGSGEWRVAGGEREMADGHGRAVRLSPWTAEPRTGENQPADDAELLFRKTYAHRQNREPAQAGELRRRILTLKRPEQFCSFDQGIYGHLTKCNLVALAQERGERQEALAFWRAILEEFPGDREAMAAIQRLEGDGSS